MDVILGNEKKDKDNNEKEIKKSTKDLKDKIKKKKNKLRIIGDTVVSNNNNNNNNNGNNNYNGINNENNNINLNENENETNSIAYQKNYENQKKKLSEFIDNMELKLTNEMMDDTTRNQIYYDVDIAKRDLKLLEENKNLVKNISSGFKAHNTKLKNEKNKLNDSFEKSQVDNKILNEKTKFLEKHINDYKQNHTDNLKELNINHKNLIDEYKSDITKLKKDLQSVNLEKEEKSNIIKDLMNKYNNSQSKYDDLLKNKNKINIKEFEKKESEYLSDISDTNNKIKQKSLGVKLIKLMKNSKQKKSIKSDEQVSESIDSENKIKNNKKTIKSDNEKTIKSDNETNDYKKELTDNIIKNKKTLTMPGFSFIKRFISKFDFSKKKLIKVNENLNQIEKTIDTKKENSSEDLESKSNDNKYIKKGDKISSSSSSSSSDKGTPAGNMVRKKKNYVATIGESSSSSSESSKEKKPIDDHKEGLINYNKSNSSSDKENTKVNKKEVMESEDDLKSIKSHRSIKDLKSILKNVSNSIKEDEKKIKNSDKKKKLKEEKEKEEEENQIVPYKKKKNYIKNSQKLLNNSIEHINNFNKDIYNTLTPIISDQFNNVTDIVKSGANLIGSTGYNALSKLPRAMLNLTKGGLKLTNQTANLASNVVKGSIPVLGYTANKLIDAGAGAISMSGTGISNMADALNFVNTQFANANNQLNIFKESKTIISEEDIYNQLQKLDYNGLNTLIDLMSNMIYNDNTISNKENKIKHMHDLFTNDDYTGITKLINELRTKRKGGLNTIRNMINNMFDTKPVTTESIKSIQHDMTKLSESIEIVEKKFKKEKDNVVKKQLDNERDDKLMVFDLLQSQFKKSRALLEFYQTKSKEESRYIPDKKKEKITYEQLKNKLQDEVTQKIKDKNKFEDFEEEKFQDFENNVKIIDEKTKNKYATKLSDFDIFSKIKEKNQIDNISKNDLYNIIAQVISANPAKFRNTKLTRYSSKNDFVNFIKENKIKISEK